MKFVTPTGGAMLQCENDETFYNDAEALVPLFRPAGTDVPLHYSSKQDAYHPSGPSNPNGSSRNQQPLHESGGIHKIKVVVADDEQMIANTLALILNRSGFEARAVYSGEAAIEVLSSFEPDVLISDVVMTGVNGVQAAIAARALRPNCKVLLFSGQAATADLLKEARTLGYSFEIISKPVHPRELLARLRTGTIN
jgi:CheY-like chemotaxis protein